MPNIDSTITYGDLLPILISLVAGIWAFIYYQLIQPDAARQRFVEVLYHGHVRNLYQGAINWFLHGLQKLYGDKESLQAFSISLLLAYLYPFLFFLWTYGQLGDVATLLNNEVWFSENLSSSNYPQLLLLSLAVIFFSFGMLDRFGRKYGVVGRLLSRLISIIIFSEVVSLSLDYVPESIVLIPALLFLPTIFVFSTQPILSTVKTYSFFIAAIFTWICAGGLATLANYIGAYESSVMLALFYLSLPLANALLDWLSWWVSRWFLERTAQAPRLQVILPDIAADFSVAVLFMLALCLLMPAAAILLDGVYAGWLDVKSGTAVQTGWREYALLARDDPWGKGIMVTLMLVTTLIPTLLHIFFGFVALLIHGFKGKELAVFLDNTQSGDNLRFLVASVWVFGYGVTAFAAMWGLYHLVQHFAQLPIAQGLYNFTGLFYDLP